MFKTHESVALGSFGQYGDGYRHWRLIERDLNNPWFHLTVSFEDRGENRVKSVFPNDVNILHHLVSEAGNGIDVVAVQVVLPPHLTGKNHWVMESLMRIELAHSANGEAVNIFHSNTGSTYYDPLLSEAEQGELSARTTIYFCHSST